MTSGRNNDPSLVAKALAKVQSVEARLNQLIANTGALQPSVMYAPTNTVVTQTADGDYTFTAPAGVTSVTVECWGGGGGGAGCGVSGGSNTGGPGGGGGEYARDTIAVTPGNTYNYHVGAGGAGGANNNDGVDGDDTFFTGDTVTVFANGGSKGDRSIDGNWLGGLGGTGSVNSVHFDGGKGGNEATGHLGGGGGGGGAGSAGAGGNAGGGGLSGGGTAGAAGTPDGGAGSTGGASGSNGSNGSAPGAGGSGSGYASGGGTISKSYSPVQTRSWYGSDASIYGGTNNATRSLNSTMWHGGETASGGGVNGDQKSACIYNTTQIQSDFAGATMTGATVELHNLHTYISGGHMNVQMRSWGSGLGSSLPSSWNGSGAGSLGNVTIDEYDYHTYSFPTTAAGFQAGTCLGFVLGPGVGGFNTAWYGYFAGGSGGPLLTLTGTTGSGFTSAGAGADGQVKITYQSSTTLVAAVQPVAVTDDAGNDIAAGLTGTVTAIQPGSSPASLETWHTMSLSNSWTVGSGGFAQYKLLADSNMVLIRLSNITPGTIADGTVLWVFPTGYVPVTQQKLPLITTYTAAPSYGSMPFLYANLSTGLEVFDLRGTVNYIAATAVYTLD